MGTIKLRRPTIDGWDIAMDVVNIIPRLLPERFLLLMSS